MILLILPSDYKEKNASPFYFTFVASIIAICVTYQMYVVWIP